MRSASPSGKPTRVRWWMLSLVMVVMAINYMDRGNLAVAAPVMQKELGIDAAMMGLLFSIFAWTYALMTPFAGAFVDRIGPRNMFSGALLGWSAFTCLIGTVSTLPAILACRMAVGVFEAPAIPTNFRCVSAWFPNKERAFAVGLYTSMQYVALGFLTPVLTWIVVTWGWREVFFVTGGIGIAFTLVWHAFYRDPRDSKVVNQQELDYISKGGGLTESGSADTQTPFSWALIARLFRERQLLGMFIGQFAIMTTMFFFLTWFPTYLIKEKNLSIIQTGYYATIPFLVAIAGALLGGKWSDWMIQRGNTLSFARKAPIIMGFFLTAAIFGANYTNDINMVIALMSVAFFGQALSSTVTGALMSDIAPKEAVGLAGGLLIFFAMLGSATSPLVVGFVVQYTGGFSGAMAYVAAISLIGMVAYLFVVGPVSRIVIADSLPAGSLATPHHDIGRPSEQV